jgi:hypothetical protein
MSDYGKRRCGLGNALMALEAALCKEQSNPDRSKPDRSGKSDLVSRERIRIAPQLETNHWSVDNNLLKKQYVVWACYTHCLINTCEFRFFIVGRMI